MNICLSMKGMSMLMYRKKFKKLMGESYIDRYKIFKRLKGGNDLILFGITIDEQIKNFMKEYYVRRSEGTHLLVVQEMKHLLIEIEYLVNDIGLPNNESEIPTIYECLLMEVGLTNSYGQKFLVWKPRCLMETINSGVFIERKYHSREFYTSWYHDGKIKCLDSIEYRYYKSGNLKKEIDIDYMKIYMDLPKNKLREEGPMFSFYKEGLWKYYYPNGDIYKTANFVKGYLEGDKTSYDEEGRIVKITSYKRGLKNGLKTIFQEDGKYSIIINYKNGKINGKYEEYYPCGKIKVKGNYSNNYRSGVWYYYEYIEGKIHIEKFNLRLNK